MDIKLNLASRPYLNRQSIRLWLLFVCAVMILLLLFNGSYGYQNYKQLRLLEDRFQELKAQSSGATSTATGYSPEKYAQIRAEIARENQIIDADQFRWTALLDRFEELLPANVRITSVQPNFTDNSLRLACVSRDVADMTRFVDNLLTSEDLNQAFLQQHGEVESPSKVGGRTQIAFSLTIREAF
jgi:Tfp pilus assembly protein PilN